MKHITQSGYIVLTNTNNQITSTFFTNKSEAEQFAKTNNGKIIEQIGGEVEVI